MRKLLVYNDLNDLKISMIALLLSVSVCGRQLESKVPTAPGVFSILEKGQNVVKDDKTLLDGICTLYSFRTSSSKSWG